MLRELSWDSSAGLGWYSKKWAGVGPMSFCDWAMQLAQGGAAV